MPAPTVLNPHAEQREYSPWRYVLKVGVVFIVTVEVMLTLAFKAYPSQPHLANALVAAIALVFLFGTIISAIIFWRRGSVTLLDFEHGKVSDLAYAFAPLAYAMAWLVIGVVGVAIFLIAR